MIIFYQNDICELFELLNVQNYTKIFNKKPQKEKIFLNDFIQ